ncbi:ABC transporter ATP-binding protein [Parageobacillus thermoglucosidasius]|uniref:ABC transporter ATP-binding protein n=1 Tax=Parageobacillus thermoglucosidasius TaxID=1426 RepID=UPI000E147FC0|nr:ABC transporter ATP-binding protein [Parageobacillus thermoglucosidasius]MED4906235.1 ABC transporter ATP-binding protein [Parageobacillus thermoglucosidasius]MED4915484.1 ABC transporter ATP-binding protein [Parageobacillus thermoglucosidasius]MED4945840.1 ABC transporter ATP-binding protein [Parageobacillus thermoglucosidasius]MED4984319.1 ABC transporter ATP-binding protein [Parageobacillus thermoglucosidasius]RDE28632.1 ABC transporter ATP-binding protein [Parageobacillus thermoglucosid
MSTILEAKSLNKIYGEGNNKFYALRDVNLKVNKGEFLAVMGTSGSGKSTLLNMLSGLDRPTSGEVFLDGIALTSASEAELTKLRGEKIGFIFQFFNLIPVLTAEENVSLPLFILGKYDDQARKKVVDLLNLLGIGRLASSRPSDMSGGQQQRVAIARALVTEPKIILADEPTGSLDSRTSKEILDIMRHFCDEMNHTIVMVTHDAKVASYAHRIVFMEDGKLIDELNLKNSSQSVSQRVVEITRRIEGELV